MKNRIRKNKEIATVWSGERGFKPIYTIVLEDLISKLNQAVRS